MTGAGTQIGEQSLRPGQQAGLHPHLPDSSVWRLLSGARPNDPEQLGASSELCLLGVYTQHWPPTGEGDQGEGMLADGPAVQAPLLIALRSLRAQAFSPFG